MVFTAIYECVCVEFPVHVVGGVVVTFLDMVAISDKAMTRRSNMACSNSYQKLQVIIPEM